MSGCSGTIAAFANLHCLCDVSCCSAPDQKRLQGSVSWTDMRILIKYHGLLCKSAL